MSAARGSMSLTAQFTQAGSLRTVRRASMHVPLASSDDTPHAPRPIKHTRTDLTGERRVPP